MIQLSERSIHITTTIDQIRFVVFTRRIPIIVIKSKSLASFEFFAIMVTSSTSLRLQIFLDYHLFS